MSTHTSDREAKRLEALARCAAPDTAPEAAFDDLARLAARVCEAPVSLVGLVDADRVWFKARAGLDLAEVPRGLSFCTHAIDREGLFVVPDAAADRRFAGTPLVAGEPGIRFYAGVPLVTPEGYAVGTLCVMDRRPRTLAPAQEEALRALARQATAQLELWRYRGELERLAATARGGAATPDAAERQEVALSLAEEKYRSLFENAAEGIFQTTPEGRYLSANPALARLYGYDSPEALIDDLADLERRLYVEPGRRDEFMRLVERDGSVAGFESRVWDRDGRVIWISENARAVRDGGGRLLYYEGTAQDITARKRAEEQRDRLARLVEESSDFIGIAGLDGRTLYLNEAGRRLVGLDGAGDASGTSILDYLMPEDRPFAVDRVLPAVLAKGRWEGDFRFRHFKTGAAIPVGWNIFAIRDPDTCEPVAIATVTRDITERMRSEGEIRSLNARLEGRLDRLDALRQIDLAISSSHDLRLILPVVLDQLRARLQVDAAAILVCNPHSRALNYAAGKGFRNGAIADTVLRTGEGYAGRAALERRLIHVADLRDPPEPMVREALLAGEGFVAYFVVPLMAKGTVHGVLEVYHRAPLAPDREWLDFLEALAGQAAIALDNASLFGGLQRLNTDLIVAYDATIEGWSKALDLRDRETEGHTRRVTQMAVRLARTLGLGDEEVAHLRRGALLHDIGKMGIPDSILLKPGKLTEEERTVMRRHPTYAYEWLAPIPFLRPALDIPHCHHERWDGDGYPRGLKGEQIPLAARIFAVVDIWDALRSDRPYRRGWPEERVREYILSLSGTHLDPKIVAAFLELDAAPEPTARPRAARGHSLACAAS